MVTDKEIKSIIREYLVEMNINEVGSGSGDAIRRELRARLEKEREKEMEMSDEEVGPSTDPSIEFVAPSKKVLSNVCRREGICEEQGGITFGQLARIIKSAQKKKIGTDVGTGVFKSFVRLLPWFVPQIAIGAFLGSSMRAINKIIKPALETTRGYKSWWGKSVLNVMNFAEGELPISDPLSRIFYISDGLLELIGDKHRVKFARYVAEVASHKPDNEIVPDYFVENQLRDWINQKFLINPPLEPKQ